MNRCGVQRHRDAGSHVVSLGCMHSLHLGSVGAVQEKNVSIGKVTEKKTVEFFLKTNILIGLNDCMRVCWFGTYESNNISE